MSLRGLVPPNNFAQVLPGVFRSSFPKPENFAFLKSLRLKTILCVPPCSLSLTDFVLTAFRTLVTEEYPEPNVQFMQANDIQHYQIGIEANKDPFVTIPQTSISAALAVVLNPQNYPLLIHCNKGKVSYLASSAPMQRC